MTLFFLKSRLTFKIFWSVLLLTVSSLMLAQASTIAIVGNLKTKPYQQTAESFISTIKQVKPDIKLKKTLPGQRFLQPPVIVFAIGSTATRQSLDERGDNELIATMILQDDLLKNQPKTSAVLIKTSVKKQLEWHRRLLPDSKRVGVLYDPQLNQQWVDTAQQAAADLGLKIIAMPVKSAKELPSALKSLGRKADSILGITDKTVYSSKTAKAVLLYSFRNRIPFIGLSSAWVKSGAVYALDWDYDALGKQCAEIALDILDKNKTRPNSPQLPSKQLYTLNLKTVKHMKLDISQELIDGASKVYR